MIKAIDLANLMKLESEKKYILLIKRLKKRTKNET